MSNPVYEQIKALFPLVPKREGWHGPEWVLSGARIYRGELRYVAGYSHSRIGSHHLSGMVYDRIIGYGDTQDDAIRMMKAKLTPGMP